LISNPSGFSEWYCHDVDVRGDQYTFIWDQEREVTTLIGRKLGEVIRFRRNDDEDPEAFFEFRVRIDAMTNETALVVTDHAWPNEVDGDPQPVGLPDPFVAAGPWCLSADTTSAPLPLYRR
jgi:hypothetical protein